MRKCYLLFIIYALFFTEKGFSQKILNSFEEQSSVKSTQTTGNITISQSTDYPALGAYSLKAIFPGQGGTIHINTLSTGKWIRHDVFLAFVWTNQDSRIHLMVEDSLGHSFTKMYPLKKGANHLQLRLPLLKKIDLSRIQSIGIQTEEADTLYLDYLSLDHYQPALAQFGRWDINYSDKVKTSHFSWGNPLAGGPIHTYSISPVFDGRGIIELSERLSLHHKVTSIGRTPGRNRWGFGAFYARRNPNGPDKDHPYSLAFNYIADDLLFGPQYDVIIWPGIQAWNTYPKQIRDSIIKRVKAGTGLVLLYPQSDTKNNGKGIWSVSPLRHNGQAIYKIDKDKNIVNTGIWPHLDKSKWVKTKSHYITRGIPLKAFPWGHIGVLPYRNNNGDVLLKTAKGNPVLAVGKYGKGRVVAMSYPERGLIPRIDNPWQTGLHNDYWEYMWSMVARSVVWAAKREPRTYIKHVNRTTQEISAALSHVPEGASLKVWIRDSFGTLEQDTSIALKAHQKNAKIGWDKPFHGGSHIANVQLKDKHGIYDWYSLKFSASKIAQIDSINISKTMIPLGNEVHANVTLKANMQSFKGTLEARLYDNYNRLISKKTYPAQQKKAWNITLPSKGVMSHLATLDLTLQVNGTEVDRKVKELFFLLPRAWNDYDITMYNFGPNPVPGTWSVINQQLQKLHVTTLAAYTLANSKHANYEVQAQTRISGVESPDSGPDLEYYRSMKKKYLKTHNKKVLIRKYGLHDPAYFDSVKAELKNMISEWRKFSPSAYYVYEEPSLTRYDDALDLSFSDKTLNAMRQWLKQNYGTLQALNNEWGTHFKQWQQVIPDDSYEAQQRGNYASWGDHRTFMEKSWADLLKYVQNTTHQYDPGGLVQLSGSQVSSPFNGYDYSRIDHYVGQMNTYNIGNQLQFHRNFNPDLKLSGGAGYGALGKGVMHDFYQHLFLGENAGAYIFWEHSALRPDLVLSTSGLVMKDGFNEMRAEGIGKLVRSFNPANENHIAIHYSMPSIHGSWIVDGNIKSQDDSGPGSNTFEQFRRDRDGWVKILQDAGVGFDFIAYSSLENGGLTSKKYKTLILPMSVALSDKEVQQIKNFVRQGGTLIADALPGIMDGHTKFRKTRALANVFGIEPRTYTQKEAVTPTHETDLKLNGARYLISKNKTPELLYHTYGKGKAFLLNYFLDEYPEEKLEGENTAPLKKIRKVLQKAAIKPKIYLTDSSNKPAKNISKYIFTNSQDGTRLLGLLPDKKSAVRTINIHLDKRSNLYDVRNGKYLGENNSFKFKVYPDVPVLLGFISAKIRFINVNAPFKTTLGNQINISFKISGPGLKSLRSVARVDVFNPKGQKMNIYSDNCDIIGKSGTFHFRTGLNDASGKWTVRITEVISGLQKKVPIIIQ